MKKNNLEHFIEKILNVPFWIKQAVYIELGKDLKNNSFDIPNDFVSYVPTLTFKGQSELEDKNCGFDANIYNFLNYCKEGFTVLEIAMDTFFSLEETAKLLEFCIEQNLINSPDNGVLAFCRFISGKYRLGEYLNEIGMINSKQLEFAVQNIGGKKFGETLVELGFIKSNDIKQLLILKEEAQKRFVADYNTVPEVLCKFSDDTKCFEKEISDLRCENAELKKKMRQLLQLVKNND